MHAGSINLPSMILFSVRFLTLSLVHLPLRDDGRCIVGAEIGSARPSRGHKGRLQVIHCVRSAGMAEEVIPTRNKSKGPR